MDRSIEIISMGFHWVNCMNKCNVPKKKILVTSNKIFSQEIAVLRKTVLETKTLPLVIALFTVVILFILCACKSQLYVAVGKKTRHWFAIFIFFSPVSILPSILAVRTARIIIRRWKQAQHFRKIYWLREHRNLESWVGNVLCKLQHRHSDTVAYRHQLNK